MDISAANSVPVVPRRHWPERFLNSPLLLAALVLATAAFAYKWFTLEQSLKAPALPGWSWAAHPNTLLIYYPHTDCGCGPGLASALAQANARHFDVAVVTDVKGQSLQSLILEVSTTKGHLLPSVDPKILKYWIHTGNTTMLHIKNGRIIGSVEGTTVPVGF